MKAHELMFLGLTALEGCSTPTAQSGVQPVTVNLQGSPQIEKDSKPDPIKISVRVQEDTTSISRACLDESLVVLMPFFDECHDPGVRCQTDDACKAMKATVQYGLDAHASCSASLEDPKNRKDVKKILQLNKDTMLEIINDPAYQDCLTDRRREEIHNILKTP